MVHNPRVHEEIKQKAGQPDERHHEALVSVHSHPECAAIVAEEIIFYRDELFTDGTFTSEPFSMDPEPLVPRPQKTTNRKFGRRINANQSTDHDYARRFRK